jgi:hypothetical protein
LSKGIKRNLLLSISAIAFLLIALIIYSGIGIDVIWHSIENPPEPISEIIGIKIDSYPGGLIYRGRATTVYVQTTTGNKYYWADDGKNEWKQTYRNGSNEDIFSDCNHKSAQKQNSENLSYREATWCGEWDNGSVRYVIHRDGTIAYKKSFLRIAPSFLSLIPILMLYVLLLISVLVLDRILNAARKDREMITS